MRVQTIQDNGKRAIEYFKFKLDFAKNKQTHAMNLNHLITLYNTYEIIKNKAIESTNIDSLLLELIRLKLQYYNGDLPEAIKDIINLTSFNKGLSRLNLRLDLADYLYSSYYNELRNEKDFYKFMKGTEDNLETILIDEALNNIKNEIEWI